MCRGDGDDNVDVCSDGDDWDSDERDEDEGEKGGGIDRGSWADEGQGNCSDPNPNLLVCNGDYHPAKLMRQRANVRRGQD